MGVRRCGWALCAFALLVVSSAAADDLASLKQTVGDPQAKIVNGVLEFGYPSVGALLTPADPNFASSWCSGTLIGCQTFLTAGHCVDGMQASDFVVFLPNAGFFTVTGIDENPNFNFPLGDVAVLRLGTAVNGVSPSHINSAMEPPAGSAGTIVGFGRSGGNNFDYGIKRSGEVHTSACENDPSFDQSVCWLFSTPLGAPGSNSDTCNADSGGPLLIDFGAGQTVAGVTSGGSSDNCDPGDFSFDADVFQFASFIAGAGGADLDNTSCGSLPQVGSSLVQVTTESGTLSSSSTQAVYPIEVDPGTRSLRVAMTGSEDNGSDFDLYVKFESPPTLAEYDCRDYGSNQYNYCEFTAPASGTWYVMANRYAGSGPYEITATTFLGDCSQSGSDGMPCDDNNACTTNDVCSGGTCVGSPANEGNSCDDGNSCTVSDVCQAGHCTGTPRPDGTSCDDGDPCSRPDTCQGGLCIGAIPAASCNSPLAKGQLFQLVNKTPNSGDRLVWRWLGGSQTSLSDFGDPTNSTDYRLCAYDEIGGVPNRIFNQIIPAGSSWKARSNGFRFMNSRPTQSGIDSVLLRAGGSGQAGIVVKGKGSQLNLPSLGLHEDPEVVVQLLNDTTCWEADYSTNQRNDTSQFKARN